MDAEKKQDFAGDDATPHSDVVKFFRENFNTPLDQNEEWRFHIWADECAESLDSLDDYDLRGAFKDGACDHLNLPARFKKPNHLTFGEDSIYHGAPDTQHGDEYQGGQWGSQAGDTTFKPSQHMLDTTHPLVWFKAEMRNKNPDVVLILPEQSHEC